MASTSDFRNGLTIIWNGDLWTIVEFQHVKPGKGGAFVRTKLRNAKTGRINDNTFRAGEKVETARIERREHQFLYEDDLGIHLMNTDSYEQISMPAEQFAGRSFIKEGGVIDIMYHSETEQPINIEIPSHVELAVVETEPGIKGDTATNATKPATLETGAIVHVPLFVNEGDVIKVSTDDGSYITRITS